MEKCIDGILISCWLRIVWLFAIKCRMMSLFWVAVPSKIESESRMQMNQNQIQNEIDY